MVKLTFKKDFERPCNGGNAVVIPITTDGEEVQHVTSCSIKTEADGLTLMTITVLVNETLAENVAARLKK